MNDRVRDQFEHERPLELPSRLPCLLRGPSLPVRREGQPVCLQHLPSLDLVEHRSSFPASPGDDLGRARVRDSDGDRIRVPHLGLEHLRPAL